MTAPFTEGATVTLRRNWRDFPYGMTATVRYVDDDLFVYIVWDGEAALLGPDMLSMREARDVLEVVR